MLINNTVKLLLTVKETPGLLSSSLYPSSFVIALPSQHYRNVIFPAPSSSPVNSMVSLASDATDSDELAEQFLVQPQNLATQSPHT